MHLTHDVLVCIRILKHPITVTVMINDILFTVIKNIYNLLYKEVLSQIWPKAHKMTGTSLLHACGQSSSSS